MLCPLVPPAGGGFWFGNIPAARDNFGLVIGGIIVLSVLPPLLELLQQRRVPAGRA